MKHPWFASMDWEALEKDELPPPFTPEVKTSNFFSGKEDLIETFFPDTDNSLKKDIEKLKNHQHQFEFFSYNGLKEEKTPLSSRLSSRRGSKGEVSTLSSQTHSPGEANQN